MQVLMTAASNSSPVKYALNQTGLPRGPAAAALVEPDEAAAERIMAEVRRQRIHLAVAV